MNPFLMGLINQGLIHGPKIPQYAQNVGRAIQKSKIPSWAQALQNRLFSTRAGVPISTYNKAAQQAITTKPGITSALNPAFTTTLAGTAATEGVGAAGKELYDYATLPIEIPKELKKIYIDETKWGQEVSESLGNKINSLFEWTGKDIIKTKKVKKKKKKKKERLESRKKQRKLKEEPTTEEGWHIPETSAEGGLIEMKKGGHAKKKKKGYAKKQRKRKHYMASGFVKMKKKKKYIT